MGFWEFSLDEIQKHFDTTNSVPLVQKVGVGLITTGVLLEDNSLGVSYTALSKGENPAISPTYRGLFEIAGSLHNMNALDLAGWITEESHYKRIVGMATINALSNSIMRRKDYPQQIIFKMDIYSEMEIGMNDTVGVIGFMPSIMKKLEQRKAKTILVDNNPQPAQQAGYEVNESYKALTGINKAIITGSTMIYPDFEDLLTYIRKQVSAFGIFGPTAGVLPEILFAKGITICGGQWVLRPLEAFNNIIQGGMPGSKGGYSQKYWVIRPPP